MATAAPETQTGDPVAAFEALRCEVALLRRATEGLAAEKARIEIPDYSPTLASITRSLGKLSHDIEAMRGHPALELTPQSIAAGIDRAAHDIRHADHATLDHAREAMIKATASLTAAIVSARNVEAQRWMLIKVGTGAFLGGAIISLIARWLIHG